MRLPVSEKGEKVFPKLHYVVEKYNPSISIEKQIMRLTTKGFLYVIFSAAAHNTSFSSLLIFFNFVAVFVFLINTSFLLASFLCVRYDIISYASSFLISIGTLCLCLCIHFIISCLCSTFVYFYSIISYFPVFIVA